VRADKKLRRPPFESFPHCVNWRGMEQRPEIWRGSVDRQAVLGAHCKGFLEDGVHDFVVFLFIIGNVLE
jgi:hypothetical protein